ncbi:TetR/AcrR family transcriptional regulator [Actinosynnema sp. CA-248983]
MAGQPDGPMSTRERLITTAIRLFGECGIEATSLRALTEAAGTNIASVNYHFGSKEGLLRAVVDETMRVVNEHRRARLDELEARQVPPSVGDIVRAFVEPGLALGEDRARFVGRVLSEPDPRIRQLFAEQVDPVEGRYLAAMGRALPDRAPEDVRFAYVSMLGLLGIHQSGAFVSVRWSSSTPSSGDGDGERLIAFITAGVLATTAR